MSEMNGRLTGPITKASLLTELDRLSSEVENMRRIVADALSEEEVYSTPTLGGIIPLSLVEKRAILSAVNALKGNVVEAAHRLGVGKTTVYRKLKEYAKCVS